MSADNHPLWTPSQERVAATQWSAFEKYVQEKYSVSDLHHWSVTESEKFWQVVCDYFEVIADFGTHTFSSTGDISDSTWFSGTNINYAENLMMNSADNAVITIDESGKTVTWTKAQLFDLVSKVSLQLKDWGIGPGQSVVAWSTNGIETLAIMLATNSLGAIFSSTSLDFGHTATVDRFSQLNPKVILTCDGYQYNGKILDRTDEISQAISQLPSLEHVIVVDQIGKSKSIANHPGFIDWNDITTRQPGQIEFYRQDFNAPAFVLFTSGTTGLPKGIIHRNGGFVLKHTVEQRLHCDIKPGDTVLYFTTTGWMMWNWLVSCMMQGATIVLFDGNPMYPSSSRLFEICQDLKVTLLGVSAKFIDAVKHSNYSPIKECDLSQLRTIASTGSPLVAAGYEWIYQNVRQDLHLASISGGTDLCGCFVGGIPTKPVWPGEIQGSILGQDIDVLDSGGMSLRESPGHTGELVNRNSFPTVPLGFIGDDGTKFQQAYFSENPGVWTHGDFISFTENGGVVIHGRSDATLNPGGIRIGTAEIYKVVESIDPVLESIAVGQKWLDDVRVLLFVVLKDHHVLNDEIIKQIKLRIRTELSPRHVPDQIFQVEHIPRTRSGKIAEISVRQVIDGSDVKNLASLANPECLEDFANIARILGNGG
jgi:acetoacetyl-CoA synthetase